MNIHYVVAFYLGDRETKSCDILLKKDRYHYVKKHIENLNKYKIDDVTQVTFVVAKYNEKIDEGVKKILEDYPCKIPIQLLYQKNGGGSYTAWDTAIRSVLDKDFDYHFLIEDDYVPVADYFYRPFVERFTPNTAYISQYWIDNHASISNGLFSHKAAKDLKNKFGGIFDCVNNRDDWAGQVLNQVNFLNFAKQAGYTFGDVSKYCHPYLERANFIKVFGNKYGNVLIAPESTVDWIDGMKEAKGYTFTKEMTEENIMVMNKIRNHRARNFSKNPQTYTDKEAEKYFLEKKKTTCVLYDDKEIIGYLGYTAKNKLLEIRPHIVFKWDGKTYWHLLDDVIKDLAKTLNTSKILVEFAAANVAMIEAFTQRLQFTQEYVKNDAIERKGKKENIVGLSLLIEKSTIS